MFLLVINEFWGCIGLDFEVFCWLVLVFFGLGEKFRLGQAKLGFLFSSCKVRVDPV